MAKAVHEGDFWMLHVKSIDDGVELFKALGSDIRINILKLLLKEKELSMNEIAAKLSITNGALTSHIKKLEENGLIKVAIERGTHGNQKLCSIALDKILIDVESKEMQDNNHIYNAEVKVGHYANYEIYPTCGLSTAEHLIGEVDDPRYFAHPDRIDAGILWFTRGYIEYIIPNLLPDATKIDQIALSFEIGSEAPGISSDWPSDIAFFLNDTKIGMWTSAGDFGDVRGIFTPDWWYPNWNQYGVLKMLVINRKGTYIDGMKVSNVNINQLKLNYKSTLRFKFMIPYDAANVGGITLFGSGFGNYNQDIRIRITYSKMNEG